MYLIDFHSHILPGADHGSDGTETTKKQLDAMIDAGIKTVVATPHFYPNRHGVKEFNERCERAYRELSGLSEAKRIKVIRGAEILVCPGLEKMEGLDSLCIGGTNTVLLEMPMTDTWGNGILDSVEEIKYGTLTPIMAHIDRYSERQAEMLREIGVSFQLNASSLCKLFGKGRFTRMAEDGEIVALGSDLHGAKDRCMAKYVKACRVLGEELLGEIMKKSAALVGIKGNG